MTEKLAKLKKEYSALAKKYNLPAYSAINEEFDIEKAAGQETDTLLREIRKVIMDKVLAYLRFTELLLNPTNAPMFFFAILKGLSNDDKKILEGLYVQLGRLEIEVIEIDNDYSEKGEAEFINRVYCVWKGIKSDMKGISKALQRGWDKKCETREKSYLG